MNGIKRMLGFLTGLAIFIVVCAQVKAAENSKQPVNRSSIVVDSDRGICKGHLPPGVSLDDIGVSVDALAHGVECVAADFDGNGYLDFAIFGELVSRPPVVPVRRIRVLLFKENGVILNELLSGEYEKLDLYGPMSKKGHFGEPATRLPGLVKWGEGGSTEIFLYDPGAHHFKFTEYASEDE